MGWISDELGIFWLVVVLRSGYLVMAWLLPTQFGYISNLKRVPAGLVLLPAWCGCGLTPATALALQGCFGLGGGGTPFGPGSVVRVWALFGSCLGFFGPFSGNKSVGH